LCSKWKGVEMDNRKEEGGGIKEWEKDVRDTKENVH
jgi:hypothetical protein